MKINKSNLKPRGPRRVAPPGTYDAVVSGVEAGTTQNGDEMLTIEFEIREGPEAGHKFKDRIFNTPRAAARMVHVLEALGVDTDRDVEPRFLYGRHARVTIEGAEEFTSRRNGKTYQTEKIAYWGYAPDGDAKSDHEFANGQGAAEDEDTTF